MGRFLMITPLVVMLILYPDFWIESVQRLLVGAQALHPLFLITNTWNSKITVPCDVVNAFCVKRFNFSL